MTISIPSGPPQSRRDGVTPLGGQLRAERERRGAVLQQVSEATKIRKTYLEALETHDWKALPADVFTRGYIRAYAQYLGLDQEHLLNVYARERRIAGVDGPSTSERAQHDAARAVLEKLARNQGVEARRIGTRIKWIVLGLSGIGVTALAVWTFLHLLGPGRGESTTIEAPSYAERNAVAAPPRTDAIGGDNKSRGEVPDAAPTAEELPAPPAEPPGQAEPSSASHLKVGEFGVGTDVVDHRLVGRGDQFREGTVVWFWTSVLGGRPRDKIRHVWLHGGRAVAVAELNVNAAHWRTQSRRPLPEGSTGDWTVEARDPEGHVIASVGFTCLAAE
jgi:cytoskeletal protein RodZ